LVFTKSELINTENVRRLAGGQDMKDNSKELVAKMEKERGFGMPWRSILAERDPVFMEKQHELNNHALYKKNGLPRKYVEMVQCVTNAMTGHEAGFKIHFRNALKEGLKEIEMLQALEICTMSGIHYTSKMLPAFEEVSREIEAEQNIKEK
jgi:alkylhydroperoxidase/carboxymuconolactone decarboxylase family protein YurZ